MKSTISSPLRLRFAALLLVTPALASCGGTPTCDDTTALKILADHGYDKLDNIVTVTVNEKAANVTCQGQDKDLIFPVTYRVFRTTDGKIVVSSPEF